MHVRAEAATDVARVREIVAAAFAPVAHSDQREPFIVDALREAGALALALVAEEDGEVVGHIAFSAVSLADGSPGWYGLGPVAVAPDRQGRGVGGALVRAGLEALEARGATGCVLVGEPKYYERFGFRHDPSLTYPGVPPEYLLALRLVPDAPGAGRVTYDEAFEA